MATLMLGFTGNVNLRKKWQISQTFSFVFRIFFAKMNFAIGSETSKGL